MLEGDSTTNLEFVLRLDGPSCQTVSVHAVTVDGLVGAIGAAGVILAAHFPPGADNPDELPDHLIVLPVWPP